MEVTTALRLLLGSRADPGLAREAGQPWAGGRSPFGAEKWQRPVFLGSFLAKSRGSKIKVDNIPTGLYGAAID